jgi:hypothetical protein
VNTLHALSACACGPPLPPAPFVQDSYLKPRAHVHMHARTHARTQAHTHTHTQRRRARRSMHGYTITHIHILTLTHTHTHAHAHTHIRTRTRTRTRTHAKRQTQISRSLLNANEQIDAAFIGTANHARRCLPRGAGLGAQGSGLRARGSGLRAQGSGLGAPQIALDISCESWGGGLLGAYFQDRLYNDRSLAILRQGSIIGGSA